LKKRGTGGDWHYIGKRGRYFWRRPGPIQGCRANEDDDVFTRLSVARLCRIGEYGDRYIWKNLERVGLILIKMLIRHLPGETEENHEKPQWW
jgi:hypothetical protein